MITVTRYTITQQNCGIAIFVSKIDRIKSALKFEKSEDVPKVRASTLAYIVSLLPVPIISQLGSITTRTLDQQALDKELSSLEEKILSYSKNFASINNVQEMSLEIDAMAKSHKDLKSDIINLTNLLEERLKTVSSDIDIRSKDYSYQNLIECSLDADLVTLHSHNNSSVSLRDTTVVSPVTKLHASQNSVNTFHGTTFTGNSNKSSVGMRGISQLGNVAVTTDDNGPGITMYDGGSIIFESPLTGNCSVCKGAFEVPRLQLRGRTHIQCPHCKTQLAIPQNMQS